MKIYHIEFAKAGLGLSGGEKCMIEIIKYLQKIKVKNILLTTDNGKKAYEDVGLVENEFLEYVIIESYHTELKYHIFISYIIRVFYFLKIKNDIISVIRNEDVLMCHSEFFPNTIACKFLSKYFKKSFYWFHMLSPDIFKGYSGHFTNRWHLPNLRIIHYKLNQILFFCIISKQATIIAVNPYYNKLFNNRKFYTIKKFGGEKVCVNDNIQESGIESCSMNVKKYDLAFLGRFHDQKGLFEIPEILKLLKIDNPNIKLLIIGGGNEKIENKFFKIIEKEGLSKNIEYLGFINSDQKFNHLREAKIFIFPSYYESFGLVALEAMACGLPVVAYNLPVFCVFEKGIIKVPILNNKKFAFEISRILNDDSTYANLRRDAINYASTFSWDKTGEEIYSLIKESNN